MTPAESISTCLSKITDFNGRASRSEFWWFYGANWLVMMFLMLVASVLPTMLSIWVMIVAMFLPAAMSLAAAVRRLHDTGKSGWWLAATVLPIMPFVVAYFLCQPSWHGTNSFGDEASSAASKQIAAVKIPPVKADPRDPFEKLAEQRRAMEA